MKMHWPNPKLSVILYSDYKIFCNKIIRADFDTESSKYNYFYYMECHQFLNIFTEVLRKHASMKNKYIRANQSNKYISRKKN